MTILIRKINAISILIYLICNVIYSDLVYIYIYYFSIISICIFILFIIMETRYVIINKLNFLTHVRSNWLIIFGFSPLFIRLILSIIN